MEVAWRPEATEIHTGLRTRYDFQSLRFMDYKFRYSEDLLRACRGGVAIVGNATPKHSLGTIIDTYDTVIRLNNYQTEGYENLVGSRTSYRCTTGWSDIEPRGEHLEFSPFTAGARESELIPVYLRRSGRPLLVAETDIHRFLPEITKPSTGLALVQLCVEVGLAVDLFGFDGFRSPHYWEKHLSYSTHSQDELGVLLSRPGVLLFQETYPYETLYDYCHREHHDYGVNVGLELIRRIPHRFRDFKMLEFGAGNGHLAGHLEQQGNEVTAVEVSRHAFDRIPCRHKVHGNVMSLCPMENHFDWIVSVDVLEHLTENDIRLFVRQAARLADRILISVSTRPSGLLGPNGENLHLTVRPVEWWVEQFQPYFDVKVSLGFGLGQVVLEGERNSMECRAASIASGSIPAEIEESAFGLKPGYKARPHPEYFEDTVTFETGITWQPCVYPMAAEVARWLGCKRIIDVGCGHAEKLASLHPEFEVIGIDFGSNLKFCRETYSFGQWLEADLESPHPLPIPPDFARDAVVVCSDVVEHMRNPGALVEKLQRLLEDAPAAVLSTPERELTHGLEHMGPPPNPAHTREWNSDELHRWVQKAVVVDFHGLTFSNDHESTRRTILSVLGNSQGDHYERFAARRSTLNKSMDLREEYRAELRRLNEDAPFPNAATPAPLAISFCLITNGKRPEKLRCEIESIRALGIPEYEILVGGEVPAGFEDVIIVPVVDGARNGRLGEMRNRLVERARFPHLVVADDDMVFHKDFYAGLQRFGPDYEVQCVRLLNPDGTRFWDWATCGGTKGQRLLAYGDHDSHIYPTGGFCVIKAEVARQVRWDESRGFYQGEDVDFAARLRNRGITISCNRFSTVTHDDPRYTQRGDQVVRRDVLLTEEAATLIQEQRPEEAFPKLCEAFALDPENQELQACLRELSEITGNPMPTESIRESPKVSSIPGTASFSAACRDSQGGSRNAAPTADGLSTEGHDRDTVMELLDFAEYYYNRREYDLAREYLERVADLEPNRRDILHAVANLHFQLGDHEAAHEVLIAAAELSPETPLSWILLANVSSKLARHDEVEEALRRALTLQPDSVHAYHILANDRLTRNDYAGARTSFERLVALGETSTDVLHGLALCCFETGELEPSEAWYERILAADPQDRVAAENLATVRSRREEPAATTPCHQPVEEAAKPGEEPEATVLDSAIASPEPPMESPAVAAAIAEAQQHLEADNFPAAHQCILMAFREHPASPVLREMTGEAMRVARQTYPAPDLAGHVTPRRINLAILTFNALEFTQRCLASLRATAPEPINVFIVDNGSTDGTREWLAEQADPDLFVEFSPVNFGVPGGRNRLKDIILPHLPEDGFIVFADNDLEFCPGWCEHFQDVFAVFPEVGIAGRIGHPIRVDAESRELLPSPEAIPAEVDVASGGFACWIRAATLHAVGDFDERLGIFWHEDDDYCVRAIGAGWSVFAVPLAPVLHHEHKSEVGVGGVVRGGSPENQRYLAAKWRGLGLVDPNGNILRPTSPNPPAFPTSTGRKPVVVGVDARTFYLTDSTSRGIGHYALNHLRHCMEMRPDWRFVLFVEEDRLSGAMKRLVQAPNARVARWDCRDVFPVDLFHIPDSMSLELKFAGGSDPVFRTATTAIFYDLIPMRYYWDRWSEANRAAYCDRLEMFRSRGTRLLAISEFTRQDLLEATDIPGEQVETIMAGLNVEIPPEQAKADPEKIRECLKRHGIHGQFFLHVGALDPHKNFQAAVQALGRVRHHHAVQLVVVGEKKHYLKLIADKCAEMGMQDVIFTGFIPRGDLEILYQEAVALLFLSKYEGFGFPVLEAMAHGCPVLTTRVTSIPEVAGEAAMMFHPDDYDGIAAGMEGLLNEPARREELRKKGWLQAAAFPWSKPAEKTLACWEQLLSSTISTGQADAEEEDPIAAPATQPDAGSPGKVQEGGSAYSGRNSCMPTHGHRNAVWFAPWRTPSGYCSEALAMASGLDSSRDLHLIDIAVSESEGFVANLPEEYREFLQQRLRSKAQTRGSICLSHGPANKFAPQMGAAVNIGRTMFETDRLPADWVIHCNRMDEIWVPSAFNLESFRRSGVEVDKLIVIPGAVDERLFDPDKHAPMELPHAAGFNFLAVFEWIWRKGWDVLLTAYLREFDADDDVCLFLRTYPHMNPDANSEPAIRNKLHDFVNSLGLGDKKLPRIEVLSRSLPMRELPRLYRAADCLLAPSRGEGWGRPAHEAMMMGVPVVATGWGGSMEFLNADIAYLLDYTLEEVRQVEGTFWNYRGSQWANPSPTHLQTLMRQASENPEANRQKGQRARFHVQEHFGREAVARMIRDRLEEIERRLTTPVLPAVTARTITPASDTAPDKRPRLRLALEGSFLDCGSLSHVNRALAKEWLEDPAVRLDCIGRNTGAGIQPADKDLAALARRMRNHAPRDVQVVIRHQWPPEWTPPEHGYWVAMQPWEYGALPQEWVEQARNAHEIWAYSEHVRRTYINSGIHPEKIKVVPLGIDPKLFHPDVPPAELPTTKSYKFLFLGGTIFRKGPDVLLRAYRERFTASDDVCLVIKDFGGKGVYAGQTMEKEITEFRRDPNAPEILHLNEEYPPELIPGLYTACDCLVHPYRGEGFGLPVLEAMACGLPVIVTGGGATDDFATDTHAVRIPARKRTIGGSVGDMPLIRDGWVLEPDPEALGHAMKSLVENPESGRIRGREAGAYVREQWTWKRTAARAVDLLHQLIQREESKAVAIRARRNQAGPAITVPPAGRLGGLDSAYALMQSRQFSAAWKAVLQAVSERPFHPEAAMLLAEIAEAAGDPSSARKALDVAQAMAPRWKKQIRKTRKRLQGKSGTPQAWAEWPEVWNITDLPPRLSVCLIVKNEAAFLPQCLESIREVAHQIVVVDTGSSDGTPDLARSFGAEVHGHEWNDDFSAARNAALEWARGDWVLMLDADEELLLEAVEVLRKELCRSEVMAYRLPMIDVGREEEGRSYVPRLFRNAPGLFYIGRIHEQVFSSIEVRREEWGLKNTFSEALLRHHGYTEAVTQGRDKVNRNLQLLAMDLETFPNEPALLMNLGLELCRSGNQEAGVEQYFEAFRALSEKPAAEVVPEIRESLLTQLATQLMKQSRWKDLIACLDSPLARQHDGRTATMHFLMGLAHMERKSLPEAITEFTACIEHRNDRVYSPINQEIHRAGPHHCLALCLLHSHQSETCEKHFLAALKDDPSSVAVRMDLAVFYRDQGRDVEALQALHEVIGIQPQHQPAWILGAEIALARPEFLEFARDWTGEAVKFLPENAILQARRAEALTLSGDLELASGIWEQLESEIVAQRPDWNAAAIFCNVANNRQPMAVVETRREEVSQALIAFYRRAIECQAAEALELFNRNLASLAAVLPTAAHTLRAALKEADQQTATNHFVS